MVFANSNREIVQYSTSPGGVQQTIATPHKADISSLAISPDKTKVLSGGRDFTARVYDLSNGNLLCTFEELRGEILSSKIASDNDFYAFGSIEGFLYYGSISTCSINSYKMLNFQLRSV